MRLRDKVAVITGGTSGIGRACAARFLAEGAQVLIAGRTQQTGEIAAKDLGAGAHFKRCDVTVPDDVADLVRTALDRFGRIDCVVSNAGAGATLASWTEQRLEDFERDLRLHVISAFLLIKHAGAPMSERGQGVFILMSSISGERAGYNPFGYEVAKAALIHLGRCAALEFGERGVRVNCISPGPTLTDIFAKEAGAFDGARGAEPSRVESLFADLLPSVQAMPGMIRPDDIAAAATFLASDDARYVNGHNLVVDGGISAGRPASVMIAGWRAIAEALNPN